MFEKHEKTQNTCENDNTLILAFGFRRHDSGIVVGEKTIGMYNSAALAFMMSLLFCQLCQYACFNIFFSRQMFPNQKCL